MRGIPMRCGACKSWIVWGIKNARPHPYNAQFDEKGRAHQGSSHFLTCPYADNWLPKRYKNITGASGQKYSRHPAMARLLLRFGLKALPPNVLERYLDLRCTRKTCDPDRVEARRTRWPFLRTASAGPLSAFRGGRRAERSSDVGDAQGCDFQ